MIYYKDISHSNRLFPIQVPFLDIQNYFNIDGKALKTTKYLKENKQKILKRKLLPSVVENLIKMNSSTSSFYLHTKRGVKAIDYSKIEKARGNGKIKLLNRIKSFIRWFNGQEFLIEGEKCRFKAKLKEELSGALTLRIKNVTHKILRNRYFMIKGGKKDGSPVFIGKKRLGPGALLWTEVEFCNREKEESSKNCLNRRLIYLWQKFCCCGSSNKASLIHVDGWDYKGAFGAEKDHLFDIENAGIRRERPLKINPMFIKGSSSNELTFEKEEANNQYAGWNFEGVLMSRGAFKKAWLEYQKCFSKDDVIYDLCKGVLTLCHSSDFGKKGKRRALRYGVYALYDLPFRDHNGDVKKIYKEGALPAVTCSSFQAYLLQAVEHKLKLQALIKEGLLEPDDIPKPGKKYFDLREKCLQDPDKYKLQFRQKEAEFAKILESWSKGMVETKYDRLFQDVVFAYDPDGMTPSDLKVYLDNNDSLTW